MATVADIISLPSIYNARLVAPCEKAESRTVINVGILDIGPEFNGYSAYMPGEFILTNLGFTNGDELESDRALLAMIDRDVAGIGVKTVYRPHIGEAVKKKSSESGVPVYLYEGRYHEAVVFDALKLIHEDQQEEAREDTLRALIGPRSSKEVSTALTSISGVVGGQLICLALSLPEDFSQARIMLSDIRNRIAMSQTDAEKRKYIVQRFDGYALVLICAPNRVSINVKLEYEAKELAKQLHALFMSPCGVGIAFDASDFCLVLKTALFAANYAEIKRQPLAFWSEIGADKFALIANSDSLYQREAKTWLRRIEAEDADGELIKTLRIFLSYQGSISQTAYALRQHPNTIRYRLKKLKALLNMEDESDRFLATVLSIALLPLSVNGS